ncbi:hypothetical protein AtNW77_Chr1g0053171 [Arabidopsis thaliana]
MILRVLLLQFQDLLEKKAETILKGNNSGEKWMACRALIDTQRHLAIDFNGNHECILMI